MTTGGEKPASFSLPPPSSYGGPLSAPLPSMPRMRRSPGSTPVAGTGLRRRGPRGQLTKNPWDQAVALRSHEAGRRSLPVSSSSLAPSFIGCGSPDLRASARCMRRAQATCPSNMHIRNFFTNRALLPGTQERPNYKVLMIKPGVAGDPVSRGKAASSLCPRPSPR